MKLERILVIGLGECSFMFAAARKPTREAKVCRDGSERAFHLFPGDRPFFEEQALADFPRNESLEVLRSECLKVDAAEGLGAVMNVCAAKDRMRTGVHRRERGSLVSRPIILGSPERHLGWWPESASKSCSSAQRW